MTAIRNRDLNREAPHSPRDRFGGFVILARTTDKCRGKLSGKLGDYHFDCPLDNMLFSFKGVDAKQFQQAVSSAKNYEDVANWLQNSGTKKSASEIKTWSDKMEATKLKDIPTMQDPEHRREGEKSCRELGLDFDEVALFDWLDADDKHHAEASNMAGAGR